MGYVDVSRPKRFLNTGVVQVSGMQNTPKWQGGAICYIPGFHIPYCAVVASLKLMVPLLLYAHFTWYTKDERKTFFYPQPHSCVEHHAFHFETSANKLLLRTKSTPKYAYILP